VLSAQAYGSVSRMRHTLINENDLERRMSQKIPQMKMKVVTVALFTAKRDTQRRRKLMDESAA
jgi:hypothetical protein